MRSRIALRILAFNVLLVFLPVAAFTLLDSYEKSLVDSLEQALVQQARITAAWLGGSSGIDAKLAKRALAAIGDRRTARFRVVDSRGRLLADSSDAEAAPAEASAPVERRADSPSEPLIYRVFSSPTRLWRRFFAPPTPPMSSADFYAQSGDTLNGQEIQDALAGRYGAATRVSSGGQVSVTLYSAVPVYSGGAIAGAVLVSQSTYRILRDLYAIRLDIAKIFLLSLVAAAALSMLLALTIVGPMRRLGEAAAAALGSGSRPGERADSAFPESRRRDEIGDLQRSLRGLVSRLDDRALQTERFASDAAHEFRNPLAAIRSAAELAELASDPADRGRFLKEIIDDVDRLRAITDGLRRLSLAEAGADIQNRAIIDAAAAARAACDRAAARCALERGAGARAPSFRVEIDCPDLMLSADPAAFDVVLDNLLGNAASFARSEVRVVVARGPRRRVLVAVEDDGPGILDAHMGRVFDRFFTYRPGEAGGRHTGLGLSLALALSRAQGGDIEAGNRPGGGAKFSLFLPAAR